MNPEFEKGLDFYELFEPCDEELFPLDSEPEPNINPIEIKNSNAR